MEKLKCPAVILLVSGKRKSGKDYFTDKLVELFSTDEVAVIKISHPIKEHFSKVYNLNLEALTSSGELKEDYRREMIKWGEEVRKRDSGVFCRAATTTCSAEQKPIWIVSDVRRKTDVAWFKENYGTAVRTVRLEADEGTRRERGWIFTAGIDDAESECDLDDYNEWDWKMNDNGKGGEACGESLSEICDYLKKFIRL